MTKGTACTCLGIPILFPPKWLSKASPYSQTTLDALPGYEVLPILIHARMMPYPRRNPRFVPLNNGTSCLYPLHFVFRSAQMTRAT